MRRFFLVLCVCLLAVALLVTALSARAMSKFFDPSAPNDNSTEIPVYANITEPSVTPSPVVYHVSMNWGTMRFNYTPTTKMKWDSDDHLDVPDGFGGRWDYSDGVNQIKISNDSNAQLKYYVTYASEIPSVSMDIQARTQDASGVLEPMSTGGRTLKACSSTSVEESTDLIFVTPSGTIPDNIVEDYKDGRDLEVGTRTVTFVTNQS